MKSPRWDSVRYKLFLGVGEDEIKFGLMTHRWRMQIGCVPNRRVVASNQLETVFDGRTDRILSAIRRHVIRLVSNEDALKSNVN